MYLPCQYHTFFAASTSYLSTVTLVNALDSVAVSIDQKVIPIIIHNTENSRAFMDFGVLSPYLWKLIGFCTEKSEVVYSPADLDIRKA